MAGEQLGDNRDEIPEDYQERLAQRPPFTDESEWDYNDIVEGRFEAHGGINLEYNRRWLIYVGVDKSGRPIYYDDVTRRRYLGDTKTLGETDGAK